MQRFSLLMSPAKCLSTNDKPPVICLLTHSLLQGYLKVDARIPNTATLTTDDTAVTEGGGGDDVAPTAFRNEPTVATRGTIATTTLGVTSSALATDTAWPSTVAPNGLLPLSVPDLEHAEEANSPAEHNNSSPATTPDSATRLLPSPDIPYEAMPRPRSHSLTLHKNKDRLETAV